MTNQQNNDFEANKNRETLETDDKNKKEGFEVTNQGQNLGGGKKQEGGQKIGQFADDAFETQTDQTISQAAPGQTTTPTNQGSSNA
jgi:hypothetical protein